MKKTLSACLNGRRDGAKSPMTEVLQVENIGGRSAQSYMPRSYNGTVPDFFKGMAGHELGGSSDISWVTNVFVKDGALYFSGFVPPIRNGGLLEAKDSFVDLDIEAVDVNFVIDEPSFLITSHRSAHNFFHFLIEYLPRVSVMEKSVRSSSPFLFASDRTGFQYQAMDALLNHVYPVHSMSSGIFIRECGIMSPLSRVDAVDFLQQRSRTIVDQGPAKRIYISRRYASWRRVVNEQALEPVLRQFGFEIVHCEELNLKSQISLFKTADFICAPHGAALSNIAYCREGVSILEIILEERFPLGSVFWELACSAGLDYHVLSATRIPIEHFDVRDGDMYVDPESLEAALDYMITQRK